jgi:pyridoxine 5'-phosphate synthase PdxJ
MLCAFAALMTSLNFSKLSSTDVQFSLLTPNIKGFETAQAVGCKEVAVFTAAYITAHTDVMRFCRAHDIAKFFKAFINRAVDIFAGFKLLPQTTDVQFSLLTPNIKGFETAQAVGCKEVAVFTTA